MVEKKLIISIKTNDGIDHYDNAIIKHQHFICNGCGKIIDVFDNINLPIDFIPNAKVTDYEIYFKGICSDCLKKEEENYGIKGK